MQDSLVLYKNRPARVTALTDKIEIALPGGKTQRVRPKDVVMLHPGPLRTFDELAAGQADITEAWELLAGDATDLRELAELIHGRYTPATAWATWQVVAEGIYFYGSPEAIRARSSEDVEQTRAAQEAEVREAREWSAFLDRMRAGERLPEDAGRLVEVEALAEGRAARSRVLKSLGREQTPENAHALLLRVGHWGGARNPYPRRYGLNLNVPELAVPALPEEPRRDLTHLPAFAIDDEDNQDPDDALSLEGDRLWVHVADVAALVSPDSELDREARARAANLYLPEATVPMLPVEVTEHLGLGLRETSPALSIGLRVDEAGEVRDVEVVPSRIRATRLSYQTAEARLEESPFREILATVDRHRAARRARGSVRLELPEVKVTAGAGEVAVRPLPRLRSRELVTEAMLMAGAGLGRLALEQAIAFPYSSQASAGEAGEPQGMAAMYAYRRQLSRSLLKVVPGPHAGLGLPIYSQVTSPLRRYMDLVAHQQVRAWLRGGPLLDATALIERLALVEAMTGDLRRAERQSNRHWILVYLSQREGWTGRGVLVDRQGRRGTLLVPELGLEVKAQLRGEPPLDSDLELRCSGVDLPRLAVHFQVA